MRDYRFRVYFGSEDDCRNHFKKLRDERGIICDKCGGAEHYWQESKLSYECKKCKHRTSLRNGTVMENSNLPFLVWYKAIFLLCLTRDKIPAQRIQKLVGWKRYEPILKMRHKLDGFVKKLRGSQTLEGIVLNNPKIFKGEMYNIEKNAFKSFDNKKLYQINYRVVANKSFHFVGDIIDEQTQFDDNEYLDVTSYIRFYSTQSSIIVGKKKYEMIFRDIELLVNNNPDPISTCKIKKHHIPIFLDYYTRKLNAYFFEYDNFVNLLVQATNLMTNSGYKMS